MQSGFILWPQGLASNFTSKKKKKKKTRGGGSGPPTGKKALRTEVEMQLILV